MSSDVLTDVREMCELGNLLQPGLFKMSTSTLLDVI